MVLLPFSAFALVLAGLVHAVAVKRQAITSLPPSEIDSYNPYTHYASAAYCNPSNTLNWNCGANCDANPGFVPVASGGDGGATPYWYVGYSVDLQTVIVAHEGTNSAQFLAYLSANGTVLVPLNQFFTGIPQSLAVLDTFILQQTSVTAITILSAVKQTLSAFEVSSVTVVGHSLGAAIALLDGVFFKVQLSTSVRVKVITYSMPRVGNQAFADWVDNNLNVTHINNKEDLIPDKPTLSSGFHQPSGEIHIDDDDIWNNCPGQDNPSDLCSVGADADSDDQFTNKTNTDNSIGPYNGILIGC